MGVSDQFESKVYQSTNGALVTPPSNHGCPATMLMWRSTTMDDVVGKQSIQQTQIAGQPSVQVIKTKVNVKVKVKTVIRSSVHKENLAVIR